MGITVNQTTIVEDDKKIISTDVIAKCECGNPEHVISWNEEEVAKDITKLPDGFFTGGTWLPNWEGSGKEIKRKWFICKGCAIAYLKGWKPAERPKVEPQVEPLKIEDSDNIPCSVETTNAD